MQTEFSRRETTLGVRVDLQKLEGLVGILDAQYNNYATATIESRICEVVGRRMSGK